MKRISEKKLEAFTVGAFAKRQMSKKKLEEQKKKEDEAAAAHAFQEFVETFQEVPSASKVWVKAGTYDAGSRREDKSERGKLYKPSSKLEEKSAAEKAQEYAQMLSSESKRDHPLKKKTQEKKKSNLELFKEELRQMQEEREERHKYKHMAVAPVVAPVAPQATASNQSDTARELGSFDTGDPNTTNLYLGNLSPKISEQQLMEVFGRYGPLASIKIMWPRSEEEKQRGRNCGFVAYMSRKDAERALRLLNGRYIHGYEMRMGWGKTVPIMNQPIFVPPGLLELTTPPPPSGLPFNAQPPPNEIPTKHYRECDSEEDKENMEKLLSKSVVKVFIPTEKAVISIIHRMIEFVIREGPMFELLIMNRERENPLFSFLSENESPAHIYYRWKLFSLLQGDTPSEWNEKEFRMFKNGPIWKPPIANFYTKGMPEELVFDPDAPIQLKGALSNAQRDRLEDLIRHLTPDRPRIGDAMIFCIEHGDAADEICECIAESISNSSTAITKIIARLYLISDILYNCTVKVANASFFRKSAEKQLLEIFESLHNYYFAIKGRMRAESFKSRVCNVLRVWEDWTIYPKDFLLKLRCTFLGKQADECKPPDEEDLVEDIDGAPLSGDEKDDEDLDGIPLDGAALLKGVLMRNFETGTPPQLANSNQKSVSQTHDDNDDIDGIPMDEDLDGVPLEEDEEKPKARGFIPSKWESVDPDQIEAQAVTTSKWEKLEQAECSKQRSTVEEDNDEEEDRRKRRDIELKTMQYQDDLEIGKRSLDYGFTITQQVDQYRKKLLRKEAKLEYADSPSSYEHHSLDSKQSDSPEEFARRKRKDRGSPYSPRASPSLRRMTRKRSFSPSSSRDYSPKRYRSRSTSESPKRSRSQKYGSPTVTSSSSHSRRSPPTPTTHSSRVAKSEDAEYEDYPSPARHRSHKHKHRH